MVKTLFLHIGDSKTGTSLIQNFLDINRSSLFSKFGYLYPNLINKKYEVGRFHNHGGWYQPIDNNLQETCRETINNLIKYGDKGSQNNILLSFEGWLFDDQFRQVINKALRSHSLIKVKTICYLRRIDYWAESAWKQWGLKTNHDCKAYIENNPDIQDRFEVILNQLDQWAKFFGQENIIVRPYEKQQLQHGLLHDFLYTLGVDIGETQWKATEELNIAKNHGFNRDVLEILHLCQELYSDIHDNHLFDLCHNLLDEQYKKEPFQYYQLLSPHYRYRLIERNLPYEKEIAQKYMGRKDGKIFFDPKPDLEEPWQAYQGLTLEKAIPILISMIDGTYKTLTTHKHNNLVERLWQKFKHLQGH